MYLTRMEGIVADGRSAAYAAFLDQYFDLLRRQTGILAATALQSRGTPSRYSILTRWQSREAATAVMRAEALAALMRAHPLTDLFTLSRPLEAFEVVHHITGTGRLEAAYLTDEVVRRGPGNVEAFEASRGQVYRLRQQVGSGFALSMLARFLGGGNRYLIFGAFSTDSDYLATANRPEIQHYWQEHPTEHQLVAWLAKEPQEVVKTALPDPV